VVNSFIFRGKRGRKTEFLRGQYLFGGGVFL
jgi:hypothetical protein